MNRRSFSLLLCLVLAVFLNAAVCVDELRFYLRSEPKTFNPLAVADDSSETIRYLTGGVLLRLNRDTQKLEPELATSWTVSKDGRQITFLLRPTIYFSDGTPFTAQDVKYTMDQLMSPELHSPTADSFRSGEGKVESTVIAPGKVVIHFPAPVAGLERLFDQVAIVSSQSPNKDTAALGPYYVSAYKPGSYVYLRKNPNYWKHDASGRQLPYIGAIKLEIQSNRDIEMLKFSRGEIHLINTMDADYFDRLSTSSPALVHDAGASLDSEQMWFNQVSTAPFRPTSCSGSPRGISGAQFPLQSIARTCAKSCTTVTRDRRLARSRRPTNSGSTPICTRSASTSRPLCSFFRRTAFSCRRGSSAIATGMPWSSPSLLMLVTARGSGWRR